MKMQPLNARGVLLLLCTAVGLFVACESVPVTPPILSARQIAIENVKKTLIGDWEETEIWVDNFDPQETPKWIVLSDPSRKDTIRFTEDSIFLLKSGNQYQGTLFEVSDSNRLFIKGASYNDTVNVKEISLKMLILSPPQLDSELRNKYVKIQ